MGNMFPRFPSSFPAPFRSYWTGLLYVNVSLVIRYAKVS